MPYVIDGNNLLGSWGGPRVSDGRAEVLRRVSAFCRQRGAQALVVFDGPPLRPDVERQAFGNVTVRVPPPGQDADTLIRHLVESSPRPAELIVVSSDKAVYSYARHRGAAAIRAQEWNALARRVEPTEDASEKPQVEADIDGWLAIFGGDGEADGGDNRG